MGITLRDALGRCLVELWKDHKSYKSFYLVSVRAIDKDSISSYQIGKVDSNLINDWINLKLTQGNSKSTINQKLGLIKNAIDRASNVWGLEVQHVDWSSLKLKKATKSHSVWFTEEMEQQIFNRLAELGRQDMIDLFTVLADVGARFSSIINLHKNDVDLTGRTVTLRDTKNGDDITLPLTSRAAEVFSRRIHNEYPFHDLTYSAARQCWDRLRDHFGWPSGEGYKIHALRHTCGTRLAQAGVDIRVIQKWLGHRDIRQTARYTQVIDEQLVSAMYKLEGNND
jgi:integrase